MNTFSRLHSAIIAAAVLSLNAGAALAQHGQDDHATAKSDRPEQRDQTAHGATTNDRVGDPYPLSTCPITGKELGTMGDPVLKLYEGREIRFCCPRCPEKFEKDLAANLARIDEKIIKDQGPFYPLKTSVVTGKDLPAKPYEFVYGNRLVRVGAEAEKAEFLKDPTKHLAALNKAVVDEQGKDYALKSCPVSKEELGGDMGKPVDLVVAGRLVRLCCKDCKKDVEEDPAKIIAMVDAARKRHGEQEQKDHGSEGREALEHHPK